MAPGQSAAIHRREDGEPWTHLRLAHEVASDILDRPLNAMIWYGGWSHAAGCMTGYRAQIFADKGGAPEIMPLLPFEITPHSEDEVLHAAGFLKDDKFNVTVDGIPAFFELARREKMRSAAQPKDAEGIHIVGGFIQLARLDYVEILEPHPFQTTTRLLRQWPDKLGLPISS